jgi:N-acyl amino acid synthase of PEP-CTERM/exosortase system
VGEISRLAVACQFRRRPGEVSSPGDSEALFGNLSEGERRLFPHISLGLYLAAAAVGIRENLDGVFALMEPRLARRLRFYGIRFDRVGELIEHRGQRAVHFISRDGLLNHLLPHIGGLLEAILGDLGASPAKSANLERHARRSALGAR